MSEKTKIARYRESNAKALGDNDLGLFAYQPPSHGSQPKPFSS
jgi:hypothetical protein